MKPDNKRDARIQELLHKSKDWANLFCSIHDHFGCWDNGSEQMPDLPPAKEVDEAKAKLLALHSKSFVEYAWQEAQLSHGTVDSRKLCHIFQMAEKFFDCSKRPGVLALIHFFTQLMKKKKIILQQERWSIFPRVAAELSFDQCLAYFVPLATNDIDAFSVTKIRTSQIGEARGSRSKKCDIAREEMCSEIKAEIINLKIKKFRSMKDLARILKTHSQNLKEKYTEDQLYNGIRKLHEKKQL